MVSLLPSTATETPDRKKYKLRFSRNYQTLLFYNNYIPVIKLIKIDSADSKSFKKAQWFPAQKIIMS